MMKSSRLQIDVHVAKRFYSVINISALHRDVVMKQLTLRTEAIIVDKLAQLLQLRKTFRQLGKNHSGTFSGLRHATLGSNIRFHRAR